MWEGWVVDGCTAHDTTYYDMSRFLSGLGRRPLTSTDNTNTTTDNNTTITTITTTNNNTTTN